MRTLLLAGLGPYFKQTTDLDGTLFDAAWRPDDSWRAEGLDASLLAALGFRTADGRWHHLLRPERSGSLALDVGEVHQIDRRPIPSLSASTLMSILRRSGFEFEYHDLDVVWSNSAEPTSGDVDAVLLSTTFICDRHSLARAIAWIEARYPGRPIVVGGQFSNLKYDDILRRHQAVSCVVRGDGEAALPAVLRALASGTSPAGSPNTVVRRESGDGIIVPDLEYVDIEATPSPDFLGETPIVPYESMRGCPYRCRFCSFPAASPQWRYKSATKIVDDWQRYRDDNGAQHIRALDSTFTVPPPRFHELLRRLPEVGIGWEAFTRANSISSPEIVERLQAANCRTLSIGFEAMSDNALDYMNKKVSSAQNRRAFELLRDSPVGYRISFMVGYPGETPDDYDETHRFLVDEYQGHFQLYVFSLQDETMPVWEDQERFDLRVLDADDPDYAWKHCGMDVGTARALRAETLREVRRRNDRAVPFLWQPEYQTPLLPHRTVRDNYDAEKAVERLAFAPLDATDPERALDLARDNLQRLGALGVTVGDTPSAHGADGAAVGTSADRRSLPLASRGSESTSR